MSGTTALFIVDMQNDFVSPNTSSCVSGAAATIPKLCEVLEFARKNKYFIFHIVREYRPDGSDVELTRMNNFLNNTKAAIPGTWGCEIVKELTPLENEYRIVKPRFSAFMQTELEFILRRLAIKKILICGTQYPNCIRATAYDAICFDYDTTVITDATSAASLEIAKANIIDMKAVGISCLTFDEYKLSIHK
jgi:nicotinamidase-related amidase